MKAQEFKFPHPHEVRVARQCCTPGTTFKEEQKMFSAANLNHLNINVLYKKQQWRLVLILSNQSQKLSNEDLQH